MQLNRFTPLIAAVFCAATCVQTAWGGLEDRVAEIIRAGGMADAKFSVAAIDLTTGEQLIDLNGDAPMIPASNMKLVTSAAALHVLGPQFVFETNLMLVEQDEGRGAVIAVRGDGDPAFGDPKLVDQHAQLEDVEDFINVWVEAIRKQGVTHIRRLIIDDRIIDREFVHKSWPVGQLNRWFCAQVAGLNFYTNCLDVYARPTTPGQAPVVTMKPALPEMSRSNRAATIAKGDNTFWISRTHGRNHFSFHGKVRNLTAPTPVTVHDPPMVFGSILADRLRAAGVQVDTVNRPGVEERMIEGRVIHTIRTPIGAVLDRCNKDSQNLYAEALLKRMGHAYTSAPGGFENGASAVRAFLSRRALRAAEAASISVADGSGMSRDNRVTANTLVKLLRFMRTRDDDPARREAFLESLSIGGKDGTLQKRFKIGMNGEVRGKSGYLNGVSTISGYIIIPASAEEEAGGGAINNAAGNSRPARTVAFSILFNNSRRGLTDMKAVQNKIIDLLDEVTHDAVQREIAVP